MRILYIILSFIAFSCTQEKKQSTVVMPESAPVDIRQQALDMCMEVIIVDGHVDLPYRLKGKPEDVTVRTDGGHFDYVRAKEGGLDAPFMSIYIPAEKEMNGAMQLANELIAIVDKLCHDHPDKFARANSPGEIEANFAKGLISLPMGLENGAPVEGKLSNLDILHNKGISYITLTHSKDNHICDSSYDLKYTHGGLSQFGIEVVRRMNELGIMVDVAHVTDSTVAQVLRLSSAPVIASHSSCRHFTPGFERNLSDALIKGIAERNGIVMINFGSAFISEKGNRELNKIFAQINSGANEHDPSTAAKLDSIKKLPELMGNVMVVADHIDRTVKIAGINHVGLGSDYDGIDHVAIGLEDVSKYPNLIEELLKRGYTREDIEKICSKNLFRVWNDVIAIANKQSGS